MRTQKAMYERLSNLSGAKFDDQFVKEMVSDHKKDIGKYEKEAKSKSPLADFAKETLPKPPNSGSAGQTKVTPSREGLRHDSAPEPRSRPARYRLSPPFVGAL